MAPRIDYDLGAQLNDGTEVKLNPDEHGWAEPERLAKVKVWSLIPRSGGLPVVTVQIPEGSKPIFKSRVYGKGLPTADNPLSYRAHAIGYHDTESHWIWVMPGGNIEYGEEPVFADLYLRQLLNAATRE
jgi:hypothetical protein